MELDRGRLHRCFDCRGVWLERDAAVAMFGGRPCHFEPPASDGAQCSVCRGAMAGLYFIGEAPVRVCGSHGVWLGPTDRVLLPEPLQRKLKRRDFVDELLGWFESDDVSSGPGAGGSSEYFEVSASDGGGDGGASCGGCGGCGGGD
jgi:hypothetical protein